MNSPKGYIIDHIDLDTYNTRKNNLRLCNRSQNRSHSKTDMGNTSGIKGVTWNKKVNKWMAYIMKDLKFINLGYFSDIEEAGRARKKAEILYFDDFQPV